MEAVKALSKIGYEVDHQTGSHLILRNKEYPHRRLTIPNHKVLENFKEIFWTPKIASDFLVRLQKGPLG